MYKCYQETSREQEQNWKYVCVCTHRGTFYFKVRSILCVFFFSFYLNYFIKIWLTHIKLYKFNMSYLRIWRQVSLSLVTQSCLTLCDPMDGSPPGSSVHGISMDSRMLEWVATSFSRGSSWPRDWIWVSCSAGEFFTTGPPGKPHRSGARWYLSLSDLFHCAWGNPGLILSDNSRRKWDHS